MCKPVSDKTETAVAYLAARFWFVGSRISLVALHGVLPRQPRPYTDIASCGADNSLLGKSAGISWQMHQRRRISDKQTSVGLRAELKNRWRPNNREGPSVALARH